LLVFQVTVKALYDYRSRNEGELYWMQKTNYKVAKLKSFLPTLSFTVDFGSKFPLYPEWILCMTSLSSVQSIKPGVESKDKAIERPNIIR